VARALPARNRKRQYEIAAPVGATLPVEGDNHVAGWMTGFSRRTSRGEVVNQRTPSVWRAVNNYEVGVEVLPGRHDESAPDETLPPL